MGSERVEMQEQALPHERKLFGQEGQMSELTSLQEQVGKLSLLANQVSEKIASLREETLTQARLLQSASLSVRERQDQDRFGKENVSLTREGVTLAEDASAFRERPNKNK